MSLSASSWSCAGSFLKRLDDRVIVRDVDDFDLVNIERHDLADGRQSQRLKRTGDSHLTIADVRGKHFAGELFFVEFVAQLQVLDGIKKFNDLLVRAVAERTKESRGEKFSATLTSIEINVKQISRIELHLDPRAAVWNDAEAIEHLPVDVDGGFERDARENDATDSPQRVPRR